MISFISRESCRFLLIMNFLDGGAVTDPEGESGLRGIVRGAEKFRENSSPPSWKEDRWGGTVSFWGDGFFGDGGGCFGGDFFGDLEASASADAFFSAA